MGRAARGVRVVAAAALTAWGLAASASAQPQTTPPASPGSTPEGAQGHALPTSVDRVKDRLSREPVIQLDHGPIFRVEIAERRPRYWDLEAPFLVEPAPRLPTTRWHDEFLGMTTPPEARLFSPMNRPSETAMVAATSLLFAGAASLLQDAVRQWRENRSEGRRRAAREEVDAALAAWAAANPQK